MVSMPQSACLVVYPIVVNSYDFLFNYTMVGQVSLSMMVPTYNFNRLADTCLWLELEGFFCSDYLPVMSPFLCITIVC